MDEDGMNPKDRKNEKFDARNFIAIDTETNGFDITYIMIGFFMKID